MPAIVSEAWVRTKGAVTLVSTPARNGAWARKALKTALRSSNEELAGAVVALPSKRQVIISGSKMQAIGALAHAQWIVSSWLEEEGE